MVVARSTAATCEATPGSGSCGSHGLGSAGPAALKFPIVTGAGPAARAAFLVLARCTSTGSVSRAPLGCKRWREKGQSRPGERGWCSWCNPVRPGYVCQRIPGIAPRRKQGTYRRRPRTCSSPISRLAAPTRNRRRVGPIRPSDRRRSNRRPYTGAGAQAIARSDDRRQLNPAARVAKRALLEDAYSGHAGVLAASHHKEQAGPDGRHDPFVGKGAAGQRRSTLPLVLNTGRGDVKDQRPDAAARFTSPVPLSSQSAVLCARCRSSSVAMLARASSSSAVDHLRGSEPLLS
jgi:hypothetical protein